MIFYYHLESFSGYNTLGILKTKETLNINNFSTTRQIFDIEVLLNWSHKDTKFEE